MSYLRNYIIIALGLYGVSGVNYFVQINLLWTPWQILKTTNLFIMYCMERLNAHTKKDFYNMPARNAHAGYIEDIRDKMDTYGLKRDKIYCVISSVFYSIKNIFGISRYNKRNYLALILTILFTKRDKLISLIVLLYQTKGHHKLVTAAHKIYEIVKKINPSKLKKLGLGAIAIVVIFMGIEVLIKLWNKRMNQPKLTKTNDQGQGQAEILRELNILQNKLGDAIIVIVNRVRAIDKLLAGNTFEGYKQLAQEIIKDLNDCEETTQKLKKKMAEIEQIKDIEAYGIYDVKYNAYILALIDLSKEEIGADVLKKYQEDIACEDADYDEEFVDDAREELYDYLKQCIEYYDELDVYLAKVTTFTKGKRRGRKKIYKREQIVDRQLASEVVEDFFE